MKRQFWFGLAAAVGMLMGVAQAQQDPKIFGKPVQGGTAAQPQPQQQGTKPGPIIFGKQTRVPVNTPETGTNRPVYRRDRDGNRDWSRYHETRHNTPPGWRKGKKKGWGGCDVPPGQAKKVGCKPGHSGRWHDRDRDDHHRGRGHGK